MFCIGTIALALFLVLIFYVLMSCGTILPANYAENQVREDKAFIEAGKTLQPDSRQKLYRYALFTSEGRHIEGNLPEKQAQAAWSVTQQSNTAYQFPYNYVKVSHNNKVTVMRYSVSAQFEHPILRQYLPNAELSFLPCFVSPSWGRSPTRFLLRTKADAQNEWIAAGYKANSGTGSGLLNSAQWCDGDRSGAPFHG